MKHNAGGWVNDPLKFTDEERKFKFTDEECERLKNSAWITEEDRIKADPFIDSCQNILRHWLIVTKEDQSIAEDRRNSASQIQITAQKLISVLNTNPADINEKIAAVMYERLYLSNKYQQHILASDYLQCATGNECPDLYQMADILESWLVLLSESAGEVADIKDAPGKNKGREKFLISNLAISYEHHFGKPPAAGTDSNFRVFCSVLSEILKDKLGKEVILGKEIIKEMIDLKEKSAFTPKNP